MKMLLVCALIASVVACAKAESTAALPTLSYEELLDPATCQGCHPKHYEQWSASMHAYAAEDPVFRAMNARGQEETDGELGEFCVKCHAPMAVERAAFTDTGVTKFSNLDAVPKHLQGVTCYFCHNAIDAGPEPFNGNIKLAHDDVMRAALHNPTEPSTHKVAFSSFHDARSPDSSRMCGTCHDIMTPRGVHLERTYREYTQSIHAQTDFGFQSCQDCHMGADEDPAPIATQTGRRNQQVRARDFHPHLWPAVDLPLTDWPHADAMRSAIEKCELKRTISVLTLERMDEVRGTLLVSLEADAGHNIPTGASQDRRLWVELTGFDASGTEQYKLGEIAEGQVEETETQPHPCMMRDHMLDENGEETHDFWEADSLRPNAKVLTFRPRGSDRTISHTTPCTFQPPLSAAAVPSERVEVRVRLRPMGMDVLNDLVSTGHLAADIPARMQTLTVVALTFVFNPQTRGYESLTSTDYDCDEWRCLLDPNSPVCANFAGRDASGLP